MRKNSTKRLNKIKYRHANTLIMMNIIMIWRILKKKRIFLLHLTENSSSRKWWQLFRCWARGWASTGRRPSWENRSRWSRNPCPDPANRPMHADHSPDSIVATSYFSTWTCRFRTWHWHPDPSVTSFIGNAIGGIGFEDRRQLVTGDRLLARHALDALSDSYASIRSFYI